MDPHLSSSSSRPLRSSAPSSSPHPSPPPSSIFFGAVISLSYLSFVTWIYVSNPTKYTLSKTTTCSCDYVNGMYFSVVTLCTIGYGDIVPHNLFYKLLTSVLVLVGFGIVEMILSHSIDTFLEVLESSILAHIHAKLRPNTRIKAKYFDYQNNCMTNFLKGMIAFGVLFLCILIGIVVLLCVEKLSFFDSLYLSVISVTTVGYGDLSFNTCWGRGFASVWLLFSTFTVANIFIFLFNVRINQRQQRRQQRTQQRIRQVSMSRSEFVTYKLKGNRDASEEEIMEIVKQFSVLDPNNTGEVTLLI